MAITQRYALNAAIQYNEVDMTDYLVNDGTTGKKFLTGAPLQRLLRATESAALYFATNDASLSASARYRFYDASGNIISEQEINLSSSEPHAAIPVNQTILSQPADTVKMTVQIISGVQLFTNYDFSQGTGDAFTGWTITQPSDGFIIQSANGGLFGSRCLMMFASIGSINISQSVPLRDSFEYKLSFWARVDDVFSNAYVTGPADSSLITSTEWTYYEQVFTWIGTGTFSIALDYSNDNNDGYVYLDNVSLAVSTRTELTETRTYLYDTTCSANEIELNWLNKLGGRDSWVFTGYPIEERNVNRITPIEYARVSNLTAPNRVYANRQNVSRKGYTVTHRCGDRATAVWLKEELMDSIDVMMKVGSEYYPVQVTNGTMTTNDTFSQDYTVRFNILQAYDINIQTR